MPSKLSLALLVAAPLLAAGCKTGRLTTHPYTGANHWTIDSVPGRITKAFTGYRADRDVRYVDYQYGKKKHINLTLRRHFANNDPDNPFLADDPSRTARRGPHSLAPDPLYYMHVESLVIGAATLGVTGAFIPVPIDSVIATLDGGWGEFWDGFTGDWEAEQPPSPGKFRVKNR